jgi:hypothetical protein
MRTEANRVSYNSHRAHEARNNHATKYTFILGDTQGPNWSILGSPNKIPQIEACQYGICWGIFEFPPK